MRSSSRPRIYIVGVLEGLFSMLQTSRTLLNVPIEKWALTVLGLKVSCCEVVFSDYACYMYRAAPGLVPGRILETGNLTVKEKT